MFLIILMGQRGCSGHTWLLGIMVDDVAVGLREYGYDDYTGAMMRIMMMRTRLTMRIVKMDYDTSPQSVKGVGGYCITSRESYTG